jgi:hypothetical protein
MKIINLRTVGDFEISDSFEGILRISPNVVNGSKYDNPIELLKQRDAEIPLSDSAGTTLPLIFKPKHAFVLISKGITSIGYEQLSHMSHVYNKLYVINSLNIKSTLYIDRRNDSGAKCNQSPILFIKDSNITAFPLEAPDYADFVNYNNRYDIADKENWQDALFEKLGPTDALFTQENHPEQVLVDGKPIYRYIAYADNVVYKVPEINRRTYALGVCPGHTFNINSSNKVFDTSHIPAIGQPAPNGKYTQLSYVNLENIVWKNVEAVNTGVTRSHDGRYYNLHTYGGVGKNKLAETLFGSVTENVIRSKAPITGIGVQPLSIHYNAIPARRYFFHLERRRKAKKLIESSNVSAANLSIKGVMNNITMEYALCDGKTLYNGETSSYPIDINAYKLNLTGLHNLLLSDGKPIVTPPLFEIDQLNLRYLRGLNWVRDDYDGSSAITTKHTFSNNTKTYKYPSVSNNNDLSNHKKDINQVGMHYANYDNVSSRKWKHAHLLFAKPNGEVPEELSESEAPGALKSMLKEEGLNAEAQSNWKNYRSNFSSTSNFYNRYMMRTLGGIDDNSVSDSSIRIMQDCPISSRGGDNRYYHYAYSGLKFGRRKLGICMNHRERIGTPFYMRDGKYYLASAATNQNTYWRFITSLPIQNKYGAKGSVITEPKYSTANYEDVKLNIDDSLPSPPSINLIPLIKI